MRQSEIAARPAEVKRVFKSLQEREIFFFAVKKVGNLFGVSTMIRAGDTSPIVAPHAYIQQDNQ